MRELGKILDPANAAADHQLIDLSITLTTRDGGQGEIEDRTRDVGGTARSEADEF